MRESKSIIRIRTVVLLTFITLISKLTGFLREYALAVSFGAGIDADAYTIALNVPQILFATFMTAICNCYITVYNSVDVKLGRSEADNFTSKIMNYSFLGALALFALVVIFPNIVVKIFASGFTGEAYNLTVELVRISAFMLLAMPFSQLLASYLQIHSKPLVAAANNIPYNIFMIIAFLFAGKLGIQGIAIAGSALFFTQILVQLPSAIRIGYRHSFSLKFDSNIKLLVHLLTPILISTAVLEINTLIDRSMASGLAEGSVSSLNYAKKLTDLVFGIFTVSISAVIYPKLTRLFSEGKIEELKTSFFSSFQAVCILTMPILAFIMLFSEQCVQIIYGHGSFDSYSVQMTSSALFYYAIGMVFCATRDLLTKMFYAIQETKIAMYNSIIATIVNIILNLILIRFMQHSGLALASSIAMGVTTVLMILSLNRIMNLHQKGLYFDIMKSVVIAFVLAWGGKIIYTQFTVNSFIEQLVLIGFIGIIYLITYFLTCVAINVQIVRSWAKKIFKR